LPRANGQRGGPKEIDFVLANAKTKQFVLLEVKFKKSAKAMAGSIGKDAQKIRDINHDTLNATIVERKLKLPRCADEFTIMRAVLVVWRKGDIIGPLKKKEPPVIRRQFLALFRYMFDDPKNVNSEMLARAVLTNVPIKPVRCKFGELRWGATRTNDRYWLAVLKEWPTWQQL
jgi:hypothetical protein